MMFKEVTTAFECEVVFIACKRLVHI